MEVLAVTLAFILIALLGGGVYVLREAGRELLPGQRRSSLNEGDRATDSTLGEVRALSTEYQATLARLRERQSEIETALGRAEEAERAMRREADDLLIRLRLLGEELESRLDELSANERRELQSGNTIAQLAATTGSATNLLTRRADVVSEVYQRLARVEFSIASLTNPILLPGESLALPTDLPPEVMKWDNWKEVGENAFALGDYFNQHRHFLDETTARAIEACIGTIRETLTQRVYPNLSPTPTTEQSATLRSALDDLSVIPRLRRYLEGQYRTMVGITVPSSADGRNANGSDIPGL